MLACHCCLTMDQLLCNTVFICPEKKDSPLRSCLQQCSLHACCMMCLVILPSDRNQMEMLIPHHCIGIKLVPSVVKKAAAVCSLNETGGKN